MCQFQYGGGLCSVFSGLVQGHVVALPVKQSDGDRYQEGVFFRLSRGFRAMLREFQGDGACRGVVMAFEFDAWGACLAVPAFELGEVAPVGVRHGGQKVVTGDGLSVVPFEVQVHAFSEAVSSEQGLVHTDDFCAFFIDGDGVEVIDFLIGIGAYRMGHGAGVFGKLELSQGADVFDALDGATGVAAGQVG